MEKKPHLRLLCVTKPITFFENFCEMLSKMSKNFHLISLEVRLPVLVLQMKFKDFIRLGFLVALAAANASNDISKFNY